MKFLQASFSKWHLGQFLSQLNWCPAVDSVITTATEGEKEIEVLTLGDSCPPPVAVAIGGGGRGGGSAGAAGGGGSGYITNISLPTTGYMRLQGRYSIASLHLKSGPKVHLPQAYV